MGTRGAIARRAGDGFLGRYHHWDSYPRGLGQTLYQWGQQWGLERLAQLLIDEHPAGWSTINGADLAKPAGWQGDVGYNRADADGERNPTCYCHGDRSEDAQDITEANAGACGCEWVYILIPERGEIIVLSGHNPDGSKMIGFGGMGNPETGWFPVGTIDVNGPEPDWNAIECGENLERCIHRRSYHDRTVCPECDGDRVLCSGGHRVGYGGLLRCGPNCVPEPEAPKVLQRSDPPDPEWHVTRPEKGWDCPKCQGSGGAPVGVSP